MIVEEKTESVFALALILNKDAKIMQVGIIALLNKFIVYLDVINR
jgi:hypothetical protein